MPTRNMTSRWAPFWRVLCKKTLPIKLTGPLVRELGRKRGKSHLHDQLSDVFLHAGACSETNSSRAVILIAQQSEHQPRASSGLPKGQLDQADPETFAAASSPLAALKVVRDRGFEPLTPTVSR